MRLKSNFYQHSSGRIYYKKIIEGESIHHPTGSSDPAFVNKNASRIEAKILKKHFSIKDERLVFISKQKLLDLFLLKNKSRWSPSTYSSYKYNCQYYLNNGLPQHCSASRVNSIRRHWNICINWGIKEGFNVKKHKLEGSCETHGRIRVFNDNELYLILNETKPDRFNRFIRFAYYTGARRGEIANLSFEQIHKDYIVVVGKSGERIIKLNNQAIAILMEKETLWSFSLDHITRTFKKELRRLNISNGVFHDLRRTFGLNLIKQGYPIYQVSKLLGHKSVTTTEKHYAPLLPNDIDDFTL